MASYDPIDTCPYDPVHRIQRSRMQVHISKCGKNFDKSKKKQCPFDARHIVDELEYKYHIDVCTARESLWHYHTSNQQEIEQPNLVPIESFDSTERIHTSDEDWGKETEFKSYNALQSIQNRAVTYAATCVSKSVRKAHRNEQRKRFRELESQREQVEKGAVESKNNTTANAAVSKQPRESYATDQEYKPLRRPKKQPRDLLNTSRVSMNDIVNINEDQAPLEQNILSNHQSPEKSPEAQPKTTNRNYSVGMENPNAETLSETINRSYSTVVVNTGARPKATNRINSVVTQDSDTETTVKSSPTVLENTGTQLKTNRNDSLKSHSNSTKKKEKAPFHSNAAEDSKKESGKENIDNNTIKQLSDSLHEMFMHDERYKKKTKLLNEKINTIKKIDAQNKSERKSRIAAKFPKMD